MRMDFDVHLRISADVQPGRGQAVRSLLDDPFWLTDTIGPALCDHVGELVVSVVPLDRDWLSACLTSPAVGS